MQARRLQVQLGVEHVLDPVRLLHGALLVGARTEKRLWLILQLHRGLKFLKHLGQGWEAEGRHFKIGLIRGLLDLLWSSLTSGGVDGFLALFHSAIIKLNYF